MTKPYPCCCQEPLPPPGHCESCIQGTDPPYQLQITIPAEVWEAETRTPIQSCTGTCPDNPDGTTIAAVSGTFIIERWVNFGSVENCIWAGFKNYCRHGGNADDIIVMELWARITGGGASPWVFEIEQLLDKYSDLGTPHQILWQTELAPAFTSPPVDCSGMAGSIPHAIGASGNETPWPDIRPVSGTLPYPAQSAYTSASATLPNQSSLLPVCNVP